MADHRSTGSVCTCTFDRMDSWRAGPPMSVRPFYLPHHCAAAAVRLGKSVLVRGRTEGRKMGCTCVCVCGCDKCLVMMGMEVETYR